MQSLRVQALALPSVATTRRCDVLLATCLSTWTFTTWQCLVDCLGGATHRASNSRPRRRSLSCLCAVCILWADRPRMCSASCRSFAQLRRLCRRVRLRENSTRTDHSVHMSLCASVRAVCVALDRRTMCATCCHTVSASPIQPLVDPALLCVDSRQRSSLRVFVWHRRVCSDSQSTACASARIAL
jgi:hypothetical protein